jgi:DNA-binding SARP family transcriptional activator
MYNSGVETGSEKLNIKLFGSMFVSKVGSPPIRVPSGKLAALLGALAMNLGTELKRETLATTIWPDLDAPSARRNLRQQVFILKQFLDQFSSDVLVAEGETLLLRAELCSTDLQVFRKGIDADDEESWIAAISARSGYFLEDLDDPSTNLTRHRFDEANTRILFQLVKLRYSEGRFEEAIAFAKLAKVDDPLSERASFALIRLYFANRQFSLAKAEYESLTKNLISEAGTQPSLTYKQLIGKSPKGSPAIDFDDFTKSINPKIQDRSTSYSWRWVGVILVAGVILAIGNFFFQRSRTEASYEDLKSQFVALAAQEVSASNRVAQVEVLSQIAELAWKDAYGKRETFWQNELGPQMQKINEIMDWCSKNQPNDAVQIGGALERYYLLVSDERQWGLRLDDALNRAKPERNAVYARALYTWVIANPTGDPSVIKSRLDQSEEIYRELGDREAGAQVMRVRGFSLAATFHPIDARMEYEKALSTNGYIGSQKGVALSHFCLAVMGRDPRESVQVDQLRRTRHAIEAYDMFASVGNVWGIRSSAGLIAAFGLSIPIHPDNLSVQKDCRSRLLKAAQLEQSLSSKSGELDNVSKAVLVSQRIGDNSETAHLLLRITREGFGAGLSNKDRYLLSIASSMLSRETFVKEVGNIDPYELTLPLESQQGKAAASEAKQLARTLNAAQIISQILK